MKYLFFIIITLLVCACQDVKKPERPQNLIPKEAMVKILTDAYISNAARSVNNKFIRKSHIKLDSLLYIKYGIDSIQFAESNAYYTSDLNTYSNLIKRVETQLIFLQKRTDSLKVSFNKEKLEDTINDSPKIEPNLLIDPVETQPDQDTIK